MSEQGLSEAIKWAEELKAFPGGKDWRVVALLDALAQARAELEAMRKRLADEQHSHNETLAGWYDPAQFGALKKRAELAESQAAELKKALEEAVRYADPMRHAGINLADPTLRVPCGNLELVAKWNTLLASLPASVQARAEREQAVDAVVEAARKLEPCGICAPDLPQENRCPITLAVDAARNLAALDSAQKGERRL